MEVTERADGATVVNDAYNANPDSMGAALDALADMERAGPPDRRARRDARAGRPPRRRSTAASGATAAEPGVDVLVVVGEVARDVVVRVEVGGTGEAHWVADTDAAYDGSRPRLRPGDVVLLKSSRDAGLRWLGDRLAGAGPDADPGRPCGTMNRPCSTRGAPSTWPVEPREEQQRMRAILFGGGLALLISLLGTRVAIRAFTKLGYGQEIRDDGPTTHHTKRGTPTMGGVVIILATLVGYFAAKLITRDAAVGLGAAAALPVRRAAASSASSTTSSRSSSSAASACAARRR